MSRHEPVPLHERAADNLRFIRNTMERSSSFTAVPGAGGMAMGAVALVAAALASRARVGGADAWLRVWLVCLAVAVLLGGTALVIKARRVGSPLFRGAARKFALNMLPALVAGALLTVALVRWGVPYALPGVWMLLYGAGVAAGGAFSVPAVPVLGALFMIAGGVTLFLPVGAGDLMMALAFGGLQLGFGWLIARRHGG
ncbi:MAG: hypothetical protein ACREMA_06505 [Longimicrobiales bacterium]